MVAPAGFEPASTGPEPVMLGLYTTGLQTNFYPRKLKSCHPADRPRAQNGLNDEEREEE